MAKIEERRQLILDILTTTPLMTVGELSSNFNVSQETIRKDLLSLAEQGQIVRIHGGAALAEGNALVIPYSQRETINSEEKRRIAEAACTLIQKGDSIILESSTTNVALCHALMEHTELLETLVIVTNSFHIAQLMNREKQCDKLFFLGGWMNTEEGSVQGQFTSNALKEFHVNKAFISGAALGNNLILSAYCEDDMLFQKNTLESAASTILLIDSGKFPKNAILSVCDVTTMDYIVTDIEFEEDVMKRLQLANVKVMNA